MLEDCFGFLKKQGFIMHDMVKWILERGAGNAKVTVLIPMWAIHLRVELDDPCQSLPALGFCENVFALIS